MPVGWQSYRAGMSSNVMSEAVIKEPSQTIVFGEKEYESYRDMDEKDREFGKKAAEVVNFIDGKRSVFDLANAVSAEYSETNSEHVLKFLRDLEKLKLVSFK